MTTKQTRPQQPFVVPKKYAGQWIAWNDDRSAIVGSGSTLQDAQAAARQVGETDPGFEWIPPSDRRIIGIGR
jgi:hypothetical protein